MYSHLLVIHICNLFFHTIILQQLFHSSWKLSVTSMKSIHRGIVKHLRHTANWKKKELFENYEKYFYISQIYVIYYTCRWERCWVWLVLYSLILSLSPHYLMGMFQRNLDMLGIVLQCVIIHRVYPMNMLLLEQHMCNRHRDLQDFMSKFGLFVRYCTTSRGLITSSRDNLRRLVL